MLATVACLLGAAFLPPLPRTLGFTACCAWMVFVQHPELVNANLGAQLALYTIGACAFLRCRNSFTLNRNPENPQSYEPTVQFRRSWILVVFIFSSNFEFLPLIVSQDALIESVDLGSRPRQSVCR